jgi:hypothetical protein
MTPASRKTGAVSRSSRAAASPNRSLRIKQGSEDNPIPVFLVFLSDNPISTIFGDRMAEGIGQ